MAVNRKENYCQFKLCTLLLRREGPRLGQIIAHHSAVRTGLYFKNRFGKDLADVLRFEDWAGRLDPFVDLKDDYQEALAVYLAFCDGEYRVDFASDAVADFHEVEGWAEDFQSRFGPDPFVRIRADLVDDLCRGKLSEREFRVLSGIRAPLGDKSFAAISYDRIRLASAGFRSVKVYGEWLQSPLRAGIPAILSYDQVRRTREKLEPRGIFRSVSDGRRRFYSFNQESHDELARLVLKTKRPKVDRIDEQRKADAMLREGLRA